MHFEYLSGAFTKFIQLVLIFVDFLIKVNFLFSCQPLPPPAPPSFCVLGLETKGKTVLKLTDKAGHSAKCKTIHLKVLFLLCH